MDNLDDPRPSTSRQAAEEQEEEEEEFYEQKPRRRRNRVYAKSLKELLRRHKRLTKNPVVISTRESRIPKIPFGSLLTTVVRFHVSVKNKQDILRDLFFDLFREHSESQHEGFEVVVTFNAVLENQVSSFFYFFCCFPISHFCLGVKSIG